MKDSFILYASHEENFKMLSDTDKGKLIMAIFAFIRNEDISNTLKPLAKMAYISITNQIKISNEKYDRRCETSRLNGQLGGRPRKNTSENEESKQDLDGEIDSENLKQPNKPKKTDRLLGFNDENDAEKNLNNLKKPNENLKTLYDNDYDNEYYNDNIKLVNQENIFNNYNACTHACVSEKSEDERKPFKEFYKEVFDFCLHTDRFKKTANEIIDTMIEAYYQARTPQGLVFKQVTYNQDTIVDMFIKIDADKFNSMIPQLTFKGDIDNRAIYILGCITTLADNVKHRNTDEAVEMFKRNIKSI